MFRANRLRALNVILLGVTPLLPGAAHAFDLSGAWVSDADLCGQVFTKKGNEVVFTEFSDLYGSGFVIDGDRVKGKAAQCTIKSRKQDGNHVELLAACATTIMTQNVTFNVTFIDDDNLTRSFPEIPGMTVKYSRCKL